MGTIWCVVLLVGDVSMQFVATLVAFAWMGGEEGVFAGRVSEDRRCEGRLGTFAELAR